MSPESIRRHQRLLESERRDREALNGPLTAGELVDLLGDRLHDSVSLGAPNVVISRSTAERLIELLKEQQS